ncbi:short chain dehydrogenase [Coniochaeta ligniaria NRRL 30616]|uniref:Short chain dehydrogenase n=1 Tax=Coniochaeta ligniaria NRRL 30616 TaxID=1408157 RepID=A0A1J7JPI3_9PEZI|nr:short chain dehydrogenase [Coniochaeta ligniaria NRRL 30616]
MGSRADTPLSVKGKYAVITGAGSGINLAFARLLLSKGCSVLIADLALRPEAEELLAQHPHPPPSNDQPSALFHRTNVTSWKDLSSLFDKAVSSFPSVDIVVPGAGIFEPRWSDFWKPPKTATNPDSPSTDPADAEPGTYATIEVNLTHPIRLSQLAISHWTRTKTPGTLLHVSSCAGHCASVGTPLYYASKHGLHGFVRSLAGLRDELGIRVCAVAPGAVTTPMWSEDADKKGMKAEEDLFIEPEEIADAMLELCERGEYGDGTVLEALRGVRRVVPLYGNVPPAGEGMSITGFGEMERGVLGRLKGEGLRV